MANGQPDIFAQALERSTPGFDSLLNVIQQETSRIERNKQLVQQRKMEQELLEFKSDLQVDTFQKTQAVENQKDRDLKRDLAVMDAIRRTQENQATQQQEALEDLSEEQKEVRTNAMDEWKERYDTKGGPLLSGFEIPRVKEVETSGEQPGNIDPVYVLEDGDTMTPHEYEQNFSWAIEAQPIADRLQELISKNDIYTGTVEKQVEGTMTNALGEPVNISDLVPTAGSDEEVRTQVTKKYLGRDDAAIKIDQLRKGNKQVLEQFKSGQIDFNTIGQGEHDIIRNVRSTWDRFSETLEGTEGLSFKNWIIGIPGIDIRGDKPLINKKVSEIDSDFQQGGLTDELEVWTALKNEYSKLDNAKRPTRDLYPNPNFDRDTPVIDMFLTEEEAERARQQPRTPENLNDYGNANEMIMKQQSSQFLNQVITQPQDTTN